MNSNNQKIDIWNLDDNINIKVSSEFTNLIKNKIKERFGTIRNIYKEVSKNYQIPFLTFKTRLKPSYKYFVDLEIFLNFCKILDIPLDKLQNNIVAYKTRRGYNYIENPKLPIKITPLFDMLVAHHMSDGFVIDPKNGRKIYFGYRQYNNKYKNLYLKKIESIFGKVVYKEEYFNNKNNTQIYFPVVASNLMFKLYNLNAESFKSEKTKIPKEILNKNWKYKLAFLLGVIIDEGHIDSNLILIRLKNEVLIEDLNKICCDFNYITSIKKGKDNMFNLYILSKSLEKFYQDYKNLLNEYPEVDLGYKEEKIKEFIKRLNKPKIYINGNKNIILDKLSKETLTVNELAKRLNITRQGVRYLIKELVKEDKIEIKDVVKFGNYKYGLR